MRNKLYCIRYTQLAYEDLDEIDTYISNVLYNPQAAEKLLDEIEIAINHLKKFPYSGSKVEDAFLCSKGYRKLVVQNYLVFYLINGEQNKVIIMRILYGAREYHNLL